MKYEFITKSLDNYVLKYKDKELLFKTDLTVMSKAQAVRKKGRTKMILDLSKDGISLNDLTVVTKKDGKTYEDHTNRDALESTYIEDAMNDFFNDLCIEKFGMSSTDLLADIGILENDDEVTDFVKELTGIITGKAPSRRK